jgi:P4 family phage/plasmid primase-like protien
MSSPFQTFVSKYKVEKGSEFTHTSLGKNAGSFYIPSDAEDTFTELYFIALENGDELNFTEKHRDICPIVIDLDFKQKSDDRLYNDTHITQFLKALKTYVKQYVDIGDEKLQFYVMEKLSPRRNKSKEEFKDGIHIVVPNVVTKPVIQFMIRQKIIEHDMSNIFGSTFINTYEDIYDEAVIQKNNWFMYGSKKPDEEFPWTVTKIYDCSLNEIDNIHSDEEMMHLMSIRNKYDATPIIADKIEEVKAFADSLIKPTTNNISVINHTPSDLLTIEALVKMLNPTRAESYKDWVNTGTCLKNIDDKLLNVWIDFSKQSSKFVDGECERKWKSFYNKDGGLTEGSLRYWAKHDNLAEYNKLRQKDLENLIYFSRNETHHDLAKVVHFLFDDEFVCCHMNNKPVWYEFKAHRWVECPNAVSLKMKLSNDVFREYSKASAKYHQLASITDDDGKQSLYTEIAKKLGAIATKLKMVAFKTNVITECEQLFCVSTKEYYEKLDENKYLIGFNDGVIDLKSGDIRNGLPTDFITYSTKYNLGERDEVYIKKIKDLMESIFPDDEVRLYVWITIAYALSGNKYMEFLHFWIGTGANGKGVVSKLIEMAFGEYCYNPDVSVFTTKKSSSSSANPELAKMKGKRIAISTEPNEDDKFQVGPLKAWTGGDKIQARALYKDNIEFASQFLIIIQMNHKPALSDFDLGIARRLKNVEFVNKFVTEPKLPNERLGNSGLKREIETDIKWGQNFMHMLLDVYREYVMGDKTFETPKAVQQYTDEYLATNNAVGSFLAETCEITNSKDDKILTKELFELFKASDYYNGKDNNNFTSTMGMLGYKSVKCSERNQYRNKHIFYGIQPKTGYGFVDDSEEELD